MSVRAVTRPAAAVVDVDGAVGVAFLDVSTGDLRCSTVVDVDAAIAELEQGLAPELVEELERLSLPFGDDEVPTEAELRIAQAQLVGWLEGLFHGIQTALFAQQMAARAQLEQMRRALPAGAEGAAQPGESETSTDERPHLGRGMYL